MRILLLISLTGLIACSNQATYNAIKHNQCLEKTGKIHCDDIEDYQEYKKKRDELLKKEK
ncbi:MAG: hypothetical protein ACI8SR_000245 [Oceanicoccus sp.]|jgi:hypothetical protein